MANDPMGLDDLTLGQLGDRNDFLKGQIEGLSKAARGTGGTGANKFDEQASDFASKQIAVESEIQDRLFDIHQERSMLAQELDEERRATKADSPEQWANDPSRYDWPGIDLPR